MTIVHSHTSTSLFVGSLSSKMIRSPLVDTRLEFNWRGGGARPLVINRLKKKFKNLIIFPC